MGFQPTLQLQEVINSPGIITVEDVVNLDSRTLHRHITDEPIELVEHAIFSHKNLGQQTCKCVYPGIKTSISFSARVIITVINSFKIPTNFLPSSLVQILISVAT